MKKYLIAVLCSFLIGGFFAFYLFKDIDNNILFALKEPNEAQAFQIGVYNEKENAVAASKNYPEAAILEEEGFFRVFISVVQDEECLAKLKAYYNSQNLNYYLKKIPLTDEFASELKKYEKLLKEASDNETYVAINQEIMKHYKSEVL